MTPDALLERLASTLKQEIAPAVEAEYPRTQAFLTAVVLQKLAGQLRHADEHARADRADREALAADLAWTLASQPSAAPLEPALQALRDEPSDEHLCRFIEALYASRTELGSPNFDTLLSRVRETLRTKLDRELTYAR